MYSLFSNPPRVLGGQIVLPRFKDVGRRVIEDVEKVVEYYRHGTFFSRTDHLLVRLINQMDVPLAYTIDRYYEAASARAMSIANMLRLTTTISKGDWFTGVFYHGCQEIIIGFQGEDNPAELLKGWRQMQPVKVLDCPVSNLSYMLPNGGIHNIEEGLAVISIDIPALMVQYRGFVMEQMYLQQNGSERSLGIRDFVGKYVLPNMLYSQTDLVVHNRLFNLQSGAPMGDSRKRYPFFTSNYSSLLDKGLEELLKRVSVTKMPYQNVLENIPNLFWDHPLRMPDVAETRQVWWALFLTRMKAMRFLLDVAGQPGRHYNQALLNELRIDVKRFRSDNVFSSVLSPDMLIDVNYQLKEMLALLENS